jgi:hypothetical protein
MLQDPDILRVGDGRVNRYFRGSTVDNIMCDSQVHSVSGRQREIFGPINSENTFSHTIST